MSDNYIPIEKVTKTEGQRLEDAKAELQRLDKEKRYRGLNKTERRRREYIIRTLNVRTKI